MNEARQNNGKYRHPTPAERPAQGDVGDNHGYGQTYDLNQIVELNADELVELGKHEAIIEAGLKTFYEVGESLLIIRDARLYRGTHPTFESYCRERWQLNRSYAYEIMAASEVVNNLSGIPDIPANVAQTRPLAILPPEQQVTAWKAAVESAPSGRVTAAHVQAAVDQIKTPPSRVTYGQNEDDYQPDVPEVQVDAPEPEETWESAKDKPPANGHYSENETEWKLGGRGAPVRNIGSGQVGTVAFASGRIVWVDTVNGRRQYDFEKLERVEEETAPAAPDKERPKPSTSVRYMGRIYDAWRGNFASDNLVFITQDRMTYIAMNQDDSILRRIRRGIDAGHIGLSGGADYQLVSKIDAALLQEVEQQYEGVVLIISYADLDEDMQFVAGTAFRAKNIPLNALPDEQPDSNYKRDSKQTRPANETEAQGYDNCLTPPYALDPLLPYLGWSMPSTIWEPACGEGHLVEGLYDAGWTEAHVIGSDILTDQNFFEYQPDEWDIIVTNPPFSLKFKWLERAYELGKPFALLLPVEVLGTKTAQELMQKHGFEIMLLDQRVDFKMPNAGWNGTGAQFPVLWLCHDLLPEKVMFGSIQEGKRKFKAEMGGYVDDDPE